MNISDRTELSAILRAFYVAKWGAGADSDDADLLAGSPVFARVYEAAIPSKVAAEIEQGCYSEEEWARWRRFEDHPSAVEHTRRRIRASPRWNSLPMAERLSFVQNLIRPLAARDETIQSLLEDLPLTPPPSSRSLKGVVAVPAPRKSFLP